MIDTPEGFRAHVTSGVRDRQRRRRAEEVYLDLENATRIGLWLDELPNDPAWIALVDDLLTEDRRAFVDCADHTGQRNSWLAIFDHGDNPELYQRLRELRWQRAAKEAEARGRRLPHLLEGQRFSRYGHNLRVKGFGPGSIRVQLLDELGGVAGGSDIFDDDVPNDPPVEVSEPLPGGARQRRMLVEGLSVGFEEEVG